MKISSLKQFDPLQTASGIVLYQEAGDLTVAQTDIITLTGTDGTAVLIGCGIAPKVLTFNFDLETTAADFVTAYAADYAAVGVIVTSLAEVIGFVADTIGVPFDHPDVFPSTGDLDGIITEIQGTGEKVVVSVIPFDGLNIHGRFIENFKTLINGYHYTNRTAVTFRSDSVDVTIELQDMENQPTWTDGEATGLAQALSDINTWNETGTGGNEEESMYPLPFDSVQYMYNGDDISYLIFLFDGVPAFTWSYTYVSPGVIDTITVTIGLPN